MKYKNPPIKEAIFDIRVDKLERTSLEEIEKIHSLILKEYPNKKKQINFVSKIELKDGDLFSNDTGSEVQGFIFSNFNNCIQVQFRLDGFTMNMLKPYSEWAIFSKEAFRMWRIYQETFNPNAILRIALRYINRIEIPHPFNAFQEYISNMPPIPPCLPQLFNSFFMQVNVPCDDQGTGIIITETIEPLSKDNKLPFILDIDSFKIGNFSKVNEDLISEFNKLRDTKNTIFESCITDKTRELFN